MSLITRCPACGTMFKVVPDQLRISEGWVRCGHCSEVFDASANLQQDAVPTGGPGPGAAPERADARYEDAADDESAYETAEQSAHLPEPSDEEFASSLNTELEDALPSEAPDSEQLAAEAQSLLETPLDQPFELHRQDVGEIAEPPPARFTALPQPEPELHDLSFVRQARRQAFWRSPGMRAVLALVFLALALLLLLQFAIHERDRLAATDPALQPWLARLCEPLGCRLAPARQIEAIAIDSSSFSKLRGDAYQLSFTLKNQAAMPVAVPALELTLTDGQDQPLVRRVLLPTDLGPNPGVIGASAEWPGSLALAVAATGSSARIAGYRLLAFYP